MRCDAGNFGDDNSEEENSVSKRSGQVGELLTNSWPPVGPKCSARRRRQCAHALVRRHDHSSD